MPAPRRLKCSLTECRLPAAPITGDCTFCDGHYCSKHRLLESHKCKNLEDCKKEAFEANALQLEKERTRVIRGV
ncbi:hypothetical protein GE21DRAFT_7880 [Neurospora crassa]|uniref:AN1-type zinc finger protein n=6 Tax=Neurospora TaxID=5140 RepID=Q1K6M9_NEUCR|nr:uncharacterized protein NEUTE1DRAFT_93699 [Neurospora tetrasperma FGSC 2508]XP_960696.1 AN1-type zinc finger protein [Neurospora crassa OR74A]EGZ75383.1 hypothetical protein NEUTE2DRAFT_120308 [Neurospora tetrasperma FGSC 2509]KAJ4418252.1 hypothetical protein N0V85_001515 [Neurospora sp. IMI 360204]KAK3351492.1 hypothetical protein B0H65DRAFT_419467 [Neurospora tetraspora]KAK3491492.1 hypothetical protein B0T13DRAFT_514328 [Neurospora crassa]KAK3499818.1 hypothetical protein B0T23DRAFT_40|eukprot:XP_960696.1 AN1-type zinc finger protein [Neurospora crassa OR74A]